MRNNNEINVRRYFGSVESRLGYRFLLRGIKHYGYYPGGRRNGISLGVSQRLMERELGKSLGLPKGAEILDAGCGEGWVAIHLSRDFGYRIYGIDLLETSIRSAESNATRIGIHKSKFRLMDYAKTDFPNNHFDGIYTMESLMHASDYEATLTEFYRILKPGGVLVNYEYVLEDNLGTEGEIVYGEIYRNGAMGFVFNDFRRSKMKEIWKNAGFKNVSTEDITEHVVPFMHQLYRLAYLPFYLLKLFGKETHYINTFAGFRSYQLRSHFSLHRHKILQASLDFTSFVTV